MQDLVRLPWGNETNSKTASDTVPKKGNWNIEFIRNFRSAKAKNHLIIGRLFSTPKFYPKGSDNLGNVLAFI